MRIRHAAPPSYSCEVPGGRRVARNTSATLNLNVDVQKSVANESHSAPDLLDFGMHWSSSGCGAVLPWWLAAKSVPASRSTAKLSKLYFTASHSNLQSPAA